MAAAAAAATATAPSVPPLDSVYSACGITSGRGGRGISKPGQVNSDGLRTPSARPAAIVANDHFDDYFSGAARRVGANRTNARAPLLRVLAPYVRRYTVHETPDIHLR